MSKENKAAEVDLSAKERAEQIRKMRVERKPWDGIGSRFPQLPKRPGFDTYWFNDHKGKVELAIARGWEFSKRAGFTDNKVDLARDPNKRIRVRVGAQEDGSDMFSYAMDIPEEIAKEDRDKKAGAQAARMKYIKEGKTEGDDEGIKKISTVTAEIQSTFKPD